MARTGFLPPDTCGEFSTHHPRSLPDIAALRRHTTREADWGSLIAASEHREHPAGAVADLRGPARSDTGRCGTRWRFDSVWRGRRTVEQGLSAGDRREFRVRETATRAVDRSWPARERDRATVQRWRSVRQAAGNVDPAGCAGAIPARSRKIPGLVLPGSTREVSGSRRRD